MMTTETIRAAFEKFMSDDGKWPQAIERDGEGNYILVQSASSWHVWRNAYHQCLQSPEVQALRKDAGRYRWLRADNAYFPEENYMRGGQELDAAIDAAMEKRND